MEPLNSIIERLTSFRGKNESVLYTHAHRGVLYRCWVSCVMICPKASIRSMIFLTPQGDYSQMEFPDNSFDGLYALESTLYAKKPVDVYSEVRTVYIYIILQAIELVLGKHEWNPCTVESLQSNTIGPRSVPI